MNTRAMSDAAGDLERIEEVLRLSRSAVWEVDRRGVYTFASASHEELLGYRPEELVGIRTIHDFYPEDLSEELRAAVEEDWIGLGEEFTEMELPLVAKSGERVWVTSHGKPFFDREGRLAGFRGADTDITGRKRDRARLAESEQLLRSLVEFAPVPIAFTHPDNTSIQVNRAFTEAYGWTAEDVPTMEDWFTKVYQGEVYRREVLARWEPMVEQARRTDGRIPPSEYRVTAKDGKVHEVELSAVVFGEVIFGTFLDQTERKRVLRELEESEGSLRGLVENAPIGIVRMRLDSGRLWMNASFMEMLGYTDADLPDFTSWLERAYPDAGMRERIRTEWRESLEKARAGDGRIGTSEVRVVGKDGLEREMQFSGIVVRNEVYCLWIDLTARNRAERLLRERQDQLARVGRVSTLGQLAASLAHELEQPLGAILNNAETAALLLRRDSPDLEELRAIVQDILDDDRRAGAVLDRIRAMVRQRKFEPQAVAPEPLLREVERLLRPIAKPRGIVVDFSCAAGTPAIEGDSVLLQQALLNLGLNSVEALGERVDGRIVLRAALCEPGWIGIDFMDNAGGVPPSQYASLFEPFFTTKPNGLGMGLPLVRSIVEEHGGRLILDNRPGEGLEVRLRLPTRLP